MKAELTEQTKTVVDALSIVTVLGTLLQALPALAALFTIIWTAIRIFESRTVQKLLGKEVGPQKDVD